MFIIKIRLIGEEDKADINIKNELFPFYGKMIPHYDGTWSHSVEIFPEGKISYMSFPDENYDYEELAKDSIFVGAYDGDKCIGLAIYKHSCNKYLYLYDLKVSSEYRKMGAGESLTEEGKKLAKANGYDGIYTQGQDNNLAACLFYIKTGFVIGGLDTMCYSGTKQEGKSDIIFT